MAHSRLDEMHAARDLVAVIDGDGGQTQELDATLLDSLKRARDVVLAARRSMALVSRTMVKLTASPRAAQILFDLLDPLERAELIAFFRDEKGRSIDPSPTPTTTQ